MSETKTRIHKGDLDILRYLDRRGDDYVAMIAARTGKYPPYVNRRCQRLAEYGLLEDIDDGVRFRIADSWREQLQNYAPSLEAVQRE